MEKTEEHQRVREGHTSTVMRGKAKGGKERERERKRGDHPTWVTTTSLEC